MPILDLFSKRKRERAAAGKPDVYRYDSLPQALRVQVVHLWLAAIGRFDPYVDSLSAQVWTSIHQAMACEKGKFYLGRSESNDPDTQCAHYVLNAEIDDALDMIEYAFRVIDRFVRQESAYARGGGTRTRTPDQAIEELNGRFREHRIGYQYDNGRIVRMDSEYVHDQVTRPALALLAQPGFSGPNEEFMRAHDHYRHRRTKEAVNEACKAFESTIKAICDKRRWQYPPNATAKPLIDIVLQKGLVPAYLESEFCGLRSLLEAGLPPVRSKTSAHGQGAEPTEVPAHVAAYALSMAAANIRFLVEAHLASR